MESITSVDASCRKINPREATNSLLFIASLIAVSLALLSDCGKQTKIAALIDPSLNNLISADATTIAGVNLTKLKSTPYYIDHRRQLDIPLLDTLSGQLGTDPRRDLSDLLISWNGRDLLLTAKGHFAMQQIERQLKTSAQQTEYKHYTLFGNSRDAITFVNSEVALAGRAQSVQRAIDTLQTQSGGIPGDFTAPLDELPSSAQIWLASRSGLPFANVPMRSDIASLLANFTGYVRSTSAALTIKSEWRFEARINCVSVRGTKRIDDGLRAALGLARLTTKENTPDLLRLYNLISVRRDDTAVYISAQLAPDLVDLLIKRALLLNPTALRS